MVTNINKTLGGLSLLMMAGAAFSSCSDKEYTLDMPENQLITEITLDVDQDLPLQIGTDSTIAYSILPENPDLKDLAWRSSNEAVATVDNNGKISALSLGKTTITVTPGYGFGNDKTTCAIIVTVIEQVQKVTQIDFTNTEHELYVADRMQLETQLWPVDHTYSHLLWKSSDESIATVDKNGLVTGVAPGEVDIIAATHDGGNAKAAYHLTVKRSVAATNVTFLPYDEPLYYMQPLQLEYTTEPLDATRATIAWDSSDESVLRVSDTGLVTAVGFGTASITATCSNGNKSSIELTVAAGLYHWNGANKFEQWSINSNLGKFAVVDGVMQCTVTNDTNARIYIQRCYSTAKNQMSLNFADYPIIALRADDSAYSGTFAINLANIGNSINVSKNLTKEKLGDGTMMLYYDGGSLESMSDETGMVPVRAFMFKITKSPVPMFNIYEIGVYSSVEEARQQYTK